MLRRKGRSRKVKDNKDKFNVGTPMSKIPIHVKKSTEFGHWELDMIVLSRDKSKGCMDTSSEIKTRMHVAIKMKYRRQESVFEAIKQLTKYSTENLKELLK